MYKTNDGYYHFEDDLRNYPYVWVYAVWSRRGPGKTYSALKWAYENKIPFIYMKRTDDEKVFGIIFSTYYGAWYGSASCKCRRNYYC